MADNGDINAFVDEFLQVFEGWSTTVDGKAKAFGQDRADFLKEAQGEASIAPQRGSYFS